MVSLLGGHGVDDRLDPAKLAVVDGSLGSARHLAGPGDHADQLANRSHLLDLLQLGLEIFQAEARLHHSLRNTLGLVAVDRLLHPLDE